MVPLIFWYRGRWMRKNFLQLLSSSTSSSSLTTPYGTYGSLCSGQNSSLGHLSAVGTQKSVIQARMHYYRNAIMSCSGIGDAKILHPFNTEMAAAHFLKISIRTVRTE
ncbi:MAG: hypothetical protein LZF86_190638 [Nitrospira sp.]|nr:MAG: hypothetical protein LZF86_190638 [Nitrospira sp.]